MVESLNIKDSIFEWRKMAQETIFGHENLGVGNLMGRVQRICWQIETAQPPVLIYAEADMLLTKAIAERIMPKRRYSGEKNRKIQNQLDFAERVALETMGVYREQTKALVDRLDL
ncbi:MAG: hypothetical protein P4M13_11220 [Alphaproteobacteria bacterium]|nr:hypothetical protein [Alphaproteobacteria bacterium]